MYLTPESAGVPSSAIQKYVSSVMRAGLSPHSILIARGNDILFEKYFAPFHADFLHREYSDTKSLVSIAVGFAEQDGLLSLDDPIGKYFAEELEGQDDPQMGEQTIRQMLMMSTPKKNPSWLKARADDRVRFYFQHTKTTAPCGSRFYYDSTGSFVLGALVERLTGKRLFDYFREKLFDKIGVSAKAHCLKCPGGHSWSDSGALMKATDMVKIIRFLMDNGIVNGEQVLNQEYIRNAISNQIPTESSEEEFYAQGYGYLIWRTYQNSFFFNGMGGQFAVGIPDKDLILVVNADNQGIPHAGQAVIGGFFDTVYPAVADAPLPENPSAFASLKSYADALCLASQAGEKHSAAENRIANVRFHADENPMGIAWLSFDFGETGGILRYRNRQGEKCLPFGLGENLFICFPETGYSREVGSVSAPGNVYRCASSGAWTSPDCLMLSEQIIDEYFGRLWMTFTFEGECVRISMRKSAEGFLEEYQGEACAHISLNGSPQG